MRKLIALILVALILSVPIIGHAVPSNWAVEEIQEASEDNLVKVGLLSDYQKDITREEFAELVVKLYEVLTGDVIEADSGVFKDTDNPEVIKAYKLNIVQGVNQTEFRPHYEVTRQEMAVMLKNMQANIEMKIQPTRDHKEFRDSHLIADWARDAVEMMYEAEVLQGTGGQIDPLGNLTREQAIVVINRYHKKLLSMTLNSDYEKLLEDLISNETLIDKELTEDERELGRLINEYRVSVGLQALPISRSLTKVARIHVLDTELYKPHLKKDSRGIQGNLHSWSAEGSWEPVTYTSDHKYSELMWSKPSELTTYEGSGFEISAWGYQTVKDALNGWKGSSGHNNVIIGDGFWKNLTTMGMGVNDSGKIYHVWFGVEEDPAGYFK